MKEVKTGNHSLYIEGVEVRPKMKGGKRVSNEVYAEILDETIIVCVDVLIINRNRETVYLLKRVAKPMQGLWCLGGRRVKGETPVEGMCRKFKLETGLDISPDRFIFVSIEEYVWQDREQESQDHGSHNIAHQFVVELTDEELAAVTKGLERKEFDSEFGLQEFDRSRLLREGTHPMIRKIFNQIFPQSLPHNNHR